MTPDSLTLIGLMTALICILGPLTLPLPISPVPVSLANLALLLTASLLGMKKGTLACLLYLLIGMAGVPVFSSFSAGPGKLLGPTGGYLIGYIFLVLIAGFFTERFSSFPLQALGMLSGCLVCYLFGTLWLAYQSQLSLRAAFYIGVLPFLPGDLVKLLLACMLGRTLKKRLQQSGLL